MATPNYGYTIPVSTDIVNLLTQCYPNFSQIDTDLKAVSGSAITVATENKVGTVHNLVRGDSDRKFMYFTATSNFNAGDTFTVDGNAVTVVTPSGASLPQGAFVINSTVVAVLVGSLLTVLAGGGSNDASDIIYDNTGSGLTATNVQDAIDEIDAQVDINRADIDANTLAIASIVPGSKMTVLWDNPDPTQPMASGDTITLSSSDYDALLVVACAECNVSNLICLNAMTLKGYGFAISYAILAGTHLLETRRIFNYTSDTVITLTEGQAQTEGSSRTTDNNRIVPMKVIGVKF